MENEVVSPTESVEEIVNAFYNNENVTNDTDNKENMPSDDEVQNEEVEESKEETESVESEETKEESEISTSEEESEESKAESKEEDTISLPENMPIELQEAIKAIGDKEITSKSLDVFKKMVANHTRKSQELSKERKFAESVNSIFKGVNDNKQKIQIIKDYADFERLYRSSPEEAIRKLAIHANVDLSKIAEQEEYLSPTEKEMRRKMHIMEQELNQFKTQSHSRSVEDIKRDILEFKEAKNDKGEYLHPHFEALQNEMAEEAKKDESLTLQQLYDRALRFNDELFEQEIKKREQIAVQKQQEKKKKEIEKAKKISKSTISTSKTETQPSDWKSVLAQDVHKFYKDNN